MGLFSGFRAKFTKDSVAKNTKKDSDKNNVVCVGYKVYSEFQDPPQYLPQKPKEPKRLPAIRTLPPRPESRENGNEKNNSPQAVATPVETRIITNPNARKSSDKFIPNPTNRVVKQEMITTETANSIEVRNGTAKLDNKSDKIYVVGKTSSFNPDLNSPEPDKQPKSILKRKPTAAIIELNNEENGRYLVSEESDEDENNLAAPSKNGFTKTEIVEIHDIEGHHDGLTPTDNNNKQYVVLKNNNDDKVLSANFNNAKEQSVNYLSTKQSVTKNLSTKITQVDSDTESNKTSSDLYYTQNYSYNQTAGRIGSTSNFAANIFFGGDEEPEIQRPRRFNMNGMPNDDESRSSAEC